MMENESFMERCRGVLDKSRKEEETREGKCVGDIELADCG